MQKVKIIVAAAALSFTFTAGQAQINLGKLKDKAETVVSGNKTDGKLSNEDVVAGLKEALEVGTKKSVDVASKLDGFNGNAKIRIPFPEDAKKVKETALKFGMDEKVKTFETTLNRAAEEAAKEAAPIFVEAVKNMSVADGFAILKGENNAATKYLESNTRGTLKAKFLPLVEAAIKKVEVTKHWTPLISKYNKVNRFTGGEPVDPDLNNYVTERALNGLFVLLVEEELKIRQDPAARVTDLLSRVFGSL